MSDTSRVRVSIVGIIVVVLFSTLLARLWFLQSGSENSLKVQAVAESTSVVQTESTRGEPNAVQEPRSVTTGPPGRAAGRSSPGPSCRRPPRSSSAWRSGS